MKKCKTFRAEIFCGLRVGYGKFVQDIKDAKRILQKYVDDTSFCVTVTQTEFLYKDGNEPGIIVGIINYPRFPKSEDQLIGKVHDIAKLLIQELSQERLSIVFNDETLMLEKEDFS